MVLLASKSNRSNDRSFFSGYSNSCISCICSLSNKFFHFIPTMFPVEKLGGLDHLETATLLRKHGGKTKKELKS